MELSPADLMTAMNLAHKLHNVFWESYNHNPVRDMLVVEYERLLNNSFMVDKEPASHRRLQQILACVKNLNTLSTHMEKTAGFLNFSDGAPTWPDYPPQEPWLLNYNLPAGEEPRPKSDIVIEVYVHLLQDHSQSTETPYLKETQTNTNAPYTAVRPGRYRTKPTGPGCKNSGCYWGSDSSDCGDPLLALPAQTTAC
ncbi:hypothetical protein GJ744_007595 [Endocarpon pusillum]|uniref:Uncharacterized protein n=1 Tax=Endocarpon pusillum TaxID=364733 RepID=A0A8H7E423_9EURO|nr:hypothetical protein GJ744_007595 [Endocarpon pusillum]